METNHFITEESVTIKDFERVCRTCLSTIDLQPISEVFDLGYFPVEIALSKYTQVQFDPSDKLPQQICSNCVKNLNNSYSFLLNCDLVNTSLKECLARYESNLQTTCLPNEIEYVNCQIKEEPVEFEFSETNENAAVPPSTVNENLHTAVEIKEEAANNSVDENDSDNFDSDGDQIITNVPRSGGETDNSIPKKKTKPEMESDRDDPEIVIDLTKTTTNALPIKSRERYEVVYRRFMDWRLKKNIDSFSEAVMLKYFHELSDTMKPSSLWAIYSMLRTTISINHETINIANYPKLLAVLKNKSDGFKSKKSKILKTKEINDFLQQAPDSKYLLMKVVLIIGISGACKKQELRNMKPENIEDTGKSLIIHIPDPKKQRYFVVSETFYPTCKKYMNLRPAGEDTLPFFLNYQNEKCTKQCVGINKFGTMPQKIAEYLNLPDPKGYTGHCFRRSAANILWW